MQSDIYIVIYRLNEGAGLIITHRACWWEPSEGRGKSLSPTQSSSSCGVSTSSGSPESESSLNTVNWREKSVSRRRASS